MLPTYLGVSSLTVGQLLTTVVGFVLIYSALAVVEVWLMVKYVRKGPDMPEPSPRPAGYPVGGYAPAAGDD